MKIKLVRYGIPKSRKFKKNFENVKYNLEIRYSPASSEFLSKGIRAKVFVYIKPDLNVGNLVSRIFNRKKLHSSEEVIITGKGSFEELFKKCGNNSRLYSVLFEEEFDDLSETLRNVFASEKLMQSSFSNICVSYRKPKTKITGVKKRSL